MQISDELFDQYKFALLCNLDSWQQLENELKQQSLFHIEKVLNDIKENAAANKTLLQKVYNLGTQGFSKECLDFQSLISEIKQHNDPVLVEAAYSTYDKGLSEYIPVVENPVAITPSEKEVSSPKNIPESNDAIESMIAEIYKFRTWTNNFDKARILKENVAAISAIDPNEGRKAQQILDAGKKLSEIFQQAYQLGLKRNKNKQELADLKKEAWKSGAVEQDIAKLCMQFAHGKKKAKIFSTKASNKQIIKEKTEANVPSYDLNTPHPLYIGNLTPGKHWKIFIDETGEIFTRNALDQNISDRRRGKIVALFVPENSPLPPLKFHHANAESSERNQDILLNIFSHGLGECAVLGVTLDGMASAELDYYYTGLERLMDISLRLLTPHEDGSLLEFFVENRGDIEKVNETQAMLQRTADACLYRFAKSCPATVDKFTLKMHCIAKTVTNDATFIAHNGYVDTIACAWNGGRKELRQVLSKGGLINRCLLEGDIQEMPVIMDQITRGEFISVQQWNSLLNSPDTAVVDSPVNVLLNRLGTMIRCNLENWQLFVNEVLSHLDSKAIDMRILSRQIKFLAANQPATQELPIRLKTIWLTAMLAEKNHRGIVSAKDLNELANIIDTMYLEDAPLCCWSTLHMAVEETNAFRFANAKQIILDFAARFGLFDENTTFEKIFPDGTNIAPEWISKAAVPGIRYYGQLFSSLGQHESFMGNFSKADDHFRKAISCYKLLNDGGLNDIDQTMSYFVINRMDYEKSPEKMLPLMEEYLRGDLSAVAKKFASSTEAADKYRHAIMLRYFMELGKEHPAIKVYLERENKWNTQEGHPWEIIEFYRALLLEDNAAKVARLKTAFNMAIEGGATLHIIACVILGSIYYYDKNVRDKLEHLTSITLREIPNINDKQIAALKNQLVEPCSPMELAKIVLPFNFR